MLATLWRHMCGGKGTSSSTLGCVGGLIIGELPYTQDASACCLLCTLFVR